MYGRNVGLNINQYIYIHVPWYHSQLKSESVEQWMNKFRKTTAVRFSYWLWWTAMNFRCNKLSHFFNFGCLPSFHKPSAVVPFDCFMCAFSSVCWKRLMIRRNWYLSGCGSLKLSYWQNVKKRLNNTYVAVLYQVISQTSCLPVLFICQLFES
jgi:hypothetical protein